MLVLQVLQGPDRGKRFELPANEPQLIGRSTEALPITDATVSRRHAELTPDDGRWYLRDLESANGTFLNGRRLSERIQLSPGDQIRCGCTLMVFTLSSDGKADRSHSTISLEPGESFDVTIEGAMESRSGAPPSADARAAADHLRLVYELTAVTAQALERGDLLNRIMDLIFEEFRPDRGFILFQAGPHERPDPAVVRYKTKPRTLDEGRIPVSRTIITHVLERNEGILSTNAMNDQRFRSGDSVRDYGIRSAICVPIRTADRVFGVIHIDSSLANVTFTPPQLRLMNAVGLHTGLALELADALNARMQGERLAAVGEAVASLSHSIKNMLQALRGGADAVELALNRGDLNMAREGWPILSRNLDRIYQLTLNMLAYSKPRALEIELTNITALIREALALIAPACERKRVAVMTEFDDAMPPIPADSMALHQALMNVLTNALEAAPTKTGVITARTRFDASRQEALITISDNGSGIEPARHGRIFDAFVSSKGQRGTGLGLAVTRKILTEHGGRVELASSPGRGASFTLYLPADAAPSDPADTRLPKPLSEHDAAEFGEA